MVGKSHVWIRLYGVSRWLAQQACNHDEQLCLVDNEAVRVQTPSSCTPETLCLTLPIKMPAWQGASPRQLKWETPLLTPCLLFFTWYDCNVFSFWLCKSEAQLQCLLFLTQCKSEAQLQCLLFLTQCKSEAQLQCLLFLTQCKSEAQLQCLLFLTQCKSEAQLQCLPFLTQCKSEATVMWAPCLHPGPLSSPVEYFMMVPAGHDAIFHDSTRNMVSW